MSLIDKPSTAVKPGILVCKAYLTTRKGTLKPTHDAAAGALKHCQWECCYFLARVLDTLLDRCLGNRTGANFSPVAAYPSPTPTVSRRCPNRLLWPLSLPLPLTVWCPLT